jgi:Domain of unknown function (DUF4129)
MRFWNVWLAGVLLIAACAFARAQEDVPDGATNLRRVTVDQYRARLDSLKGLAHSCETNAAECDANKVGDDERVDGADFQTRWSWLRETLASARKSTQSDRERLMQQVTARLDEDAALAGGGPPQTGEDFRRARKEADAVLSGPEFQTVTQSSFLDRMIERFWRWMDEAFNGVSRFGKRSPWVIPVVEWGSITLAAAGLLTWVFRTMQRQRLVVGFERSSIATVWQKESDDWAEMARVEAERQDWRAAVHCLYWATIVMMEGRRLWRQNQARTPREYLLLLEPGSRMQQALRGMTQLFERIWYGLKPAAESDYASARMLFEELRGA